MTGLDLDAIAARAVAAAEEAKGYLPQSSPATAASQADIPALLAALRRVLDRCEVARIDDDVFMHTEDVRLAALGSADREAE
jgi:hypothetical protein